MSAARWSTDLIAGHVGAALGGQPQRASVTFLGAEPIDVLRFATDSDGAPMLVFVTAGASRHPMADPADLNPDPVRGPRAELVVRLRVSGPDLALPNLHRAVAMVAATPVVEGLVLDADALVDLGAPLWDGSPFTAVLLDEDELAPLSLAAPADPVRFLRAVPVTANEAAWVRLKGAPALREAWTEAGIDPADPRRVAATLGG
ncbi:suppressor of fused domain protein [Gordonia sp. X0973]|uniref:suppressor of fused domain protein n=1 Tax=Gordonia sp. X0973 TaxID=2742602 RepID=UPI000F53026D|nr:suppressor of fused domain protein [Gordonia sp. X0973]QKT06820.1 suppressor of fused domain protein [Gordonia sp. X0973]